MDIKKGDRGDEVVDVQRRLSILGYDIGPTSVDGAFEEKTEEAIKRFQESHELKGTGRIDITTWRSLVDASFRFGDRGLYLRSPYFHGNDVFKLQHWLNTLGFHTEDVDGIFGPATEMSVRDFQENVGLFPDGIVGPLTIKALTNLFHIMDKDHPSVFPDHVKNSIVSELQDKKIGIVCEGQCAENWWDLPAETGTQYIDLAYRFSNLLELLGAEVKIVSQKDSPFGGYEAVVAFNDSMHSGNIDKISIFHPKDENSAALAKFIVSELSGSLRERLDVEVGESIDEDFILSANVTLSCGSMPKKDYLIDQDKDIYRQKIASAIFDGFKKYILNI